MRVLVIGADGFAGRWLVRHLVEAGDAVWAGVGSRYQPPLHGPEGIRQVDVRDLGSVIDALAAARPDVVYGLAGVSGRDAREDLQAAIGVSAIGSMNLIQAASQASSPPRLLFVSTGYVYKASDEPVDESAELAPDSVYAAAKLAAERALTTLSPSVGADVVIARPFNHIGPGQRDAFLVPALARKVAAVPSGAASDIEVRDPEIVRDFTDVRDVVRAYRLLADRGVAGEAYNVASGRGRSVADVAATLAELAGVQIRLRTPEPVVREEAATLIGATAKIEELGWRREYDLRTTLREVLSGYLPIAAPS
jgi:GDP-4-dehydro-6-deoxy-D-mannose reductase